MVSRDVLSAVLSLGAPRSVSKCPVAVMDPQRDGLAARRSLSGVASGPSRGSPAEGAAAAKSPTSWAGHAEATRSRDWRV